jgi:acyl-CoA synthetase (AMP-forming)/AMP-acid ligase II
MTEAQATSETAIDASLHSMNVAARLNVADRLARSAERDPNGIAVVCPGRRAGKYATITFAELDADATRIARGLLDWGVEPGTRLALLVRPGIDFVALVFGLLRAGVVMILVDPGLGRRNLVTCLSEAEPAGFIAIPVAQAARLCLRSSFPRAKWNVTVGRRWFWGGATLDQIRRRGERLASLPAPRPLLPAPFADAPAAIIFTSGSTGPPKGVLYTQRMFDTQVSEIQSTYGIEPGGVDLSCFPLFALFNAAMGVTTVLPEMDFSRPASADPRKLLAAANDWKVTQAFASPAVWPRLNEHCRSTETRIETLREIFSCGASVSADIQRATLKYVAPAARMHTPYGATECLPVATIEASEVLRETAARTAAGAGVCVGRKFDSVEWRVIRVTDEPIARIEDAEELPTGTIGELIVCGPQASPRYVTREECNALAKITDVSKRAGRSSAPHGGEDAPARFTSSEWSQWHRMGDVGYVDEQKRFWYCGRKSHRVETADGVIFTDCIESVLNTITFVRRTALIGIGARPRQTPVIVYELNLPRTIYADRSDPAAPRMPKQLVPGIVRALEEKVKQQNLLGIRHFLRHPRLPVDVRHNAKINREQLAVWAATKLPELA